MNIVLVVPDSIWIFQSNQYDNNVEYLQDPQCSVAGNSTQNGTLLKCAGSSSALFDGIIGTEISQDEDLLQYYIWQQAATPTPYVAMSFDPPLEEIHNITMYFYRRIIIRVPYISVCISRSPDHTPCDKIELVEESELHSTMDVRLMKQLTNATSVTYLRIDMQYDLNDEDVFIFLSEITIRVQRTYLTSYLVICALLYVLMKSKLTVVSHGPRRSSMYTCLSAYIHDHYSN